MGNKRDKRIAAQEDKKKKFQNKRNVSISEISANTNHPPVTPGIQQIKKMVRNGMVYDHSDVFSWTKEFADTSGEWPWGSRQWSKEDWDNFINLNMDRRKKDGDTWGKIKSETYPSKKGNKKKNIHYSRETICKEARDRWEKGETDYPFEDFEEIFRFRLGNLKRLYGFIAPGGLFILLWWDPKHNICPSDPD